MRKHVTIAEENYRLKELAKMSVRPHKEFIYKKTSGEVKKVNLI